MTSCAQDELWFRQTLVPDSPAHTLCRAYHVRGDLDVAALRSAWRAVVRRHDILRTTLVVVDGLPVQSIAPDGAAPEAFSDLGAIALLDAAPHAAEAAVAGLGAELAGRPMDLAAGPLARLAVARLAPGEHAVLLLAHEAVADDRSMAILANELSAAYAAEAGGRPAHEVLPPASAQYADYARWQHDRRTTPEFRRLLEWWTARLRPLPPRLSLPADRARPAGPCWRGGIEPFTWTGEAPALAALAEAEGTTPDIVVLAAFLCLLHRLGGERTVAVGLPVSARPRPEFAGLVGPFRNDLVLCADLSGRPGFREVLRRTARAEREASAHAELPFDQLARALEIDHDPRTPPLCDVMFVRGDAPGRPLALPGLAVREVRVHNGAATADLTLTVGTAAPAVTGFLGYRADLFEPASVRLLLGQLRTLLAAALRDPGLPVDELPLEDPARIRAAVRAADLTADASHVRAPANELVRMAARRHPDRVAVAWTGGEVTYRELEERAARLTAALRAGGGVAGRPVAVRMPSGPGQVAAVLAVLDAGGHLVCLGTGDAGERGRMMLAEIRPACLVLDDDDGGDDLAVWFAEELGGRVLDAGAALRGPGVGAVAPVPPARPDARAYVAYTSGSTGRPKGIVQSHGSLAQFAAWFGAEFRLGPGRRVAQWAAPGYDAALVEIFATLAAGATLCVAPDRIRANPEKLAAWLDSERVTFLQTVPTFARGLLQVLRGREPGERALALDHLLLAGEPLPGGLANELRAALPGVRLVNLYGATESILATWHDITGPVSGTTPIGVPIPGRQVLVVDERDRPCPAGVTGEIVVRSPYVALGYAGEAAADERAFLPVPGLDGSGDAGCRFYRTGDLGRRRWDGLLEFRGRRDSRIKFSGIRMELAEIESALAAHEAVAECALVAVAGPDGLVSRLVAYVVPRGAAAGEATVSPSELRAGLRRRFGKATLPVSVKFLDSLPRNVGGKVDRRRLADPGAPAAVAPRTPGTPAEREMAAIWAELLGAEPGGADDSFFAAGGHRLLVPRLLGRVREWFGVEVSLWDFFTNPTLSGLAALVDSSAVSTQAVTQPTAG
ncbi:hypothetical protein Msi02_76840 [Microbispora siamensis]|uniref:Carrier domain-containing protein n=1 Tax=Microbispora siamensis TaxID=564413 RepID=A0ABQ4GZK8_9ACTN|nr:hypothetical protein Msi02_76840 [Microbispora siamensis]